MMPRKSNIVLNRQSRKMVYEVYCFFKKDAKSDKEALERTSEATKTSVRTVRRIVDEVKKSGLLAVFRTPGKKRSGKKKVTDIDSFDQTVIRRCVHNYHLTNKELPTVEKLREKLKQDIHFTGSESSLRRVLKQLGFRWKKTENNRRLLIEKTNIRFLRIEFLQKIKKFREEGRPIIYTDESYVDSSHASTKAWADGSTEGLKKPVSKGQRLVIVHAGSENGFVPNALLLFKAGTKSGDYHDNMNYENYEKWLRSQLMPNLPPNSVVIVDNASYHNKQSELAPTSNTKKADMQKWLRDRDIQYRENMLKPELYNLIKLNKDLHKNFRVDNILAENNHSVLRLPPYHPDLNPIEMAWANIKGYVSSKNVTWNFEKVKELVNEKVAAMGPSEWAKLCKKVKEIEDEYIKSDHVVDVVTEQFIIFADDDSESDSDDDDDEIDDDDETTEPTPGTSSASAGFDIMEGISILPVDDDD
ncbi:uncharacterized protein LOC124177619 [Neodiprion fabricii]|uniref:uncharacterized protein LOC124177619 n=1 Tax=Neodiprion fabricii TaxID=2872261 RepID=UPI001ED93969|nr:uncharacterized protein LOC124177619 [Neodiprion fabricii]